MKALPLAVLTWILGLSFGHANSFDLDSEIRLNLETQPPQRTHFQKRISPWKSGFVIKDSSGSIRNHNLRLDFPGKGYQRLKN